MAYSDEVLADSPFAYWRLDETSGTVAADATTNAADGTYVDTPTLGQTSEANLGTSVLFEGSATAGDNESVSIATTAGTTDFATFGSALDTGAYTLEFWVNTTSVQTFMAVVGIANSTPNLGDATLFTFWMNFSTADDHKMRVRDDGGVQAEIDFTFANLNDGNWHHVVIRDTPTDGTSRGVFIDGSSVTFTGSATLTGATSDFQHTFRIGCQDERGTLNDFFQGRLDEVAVYQSILSNARIQAHFDAGVEQFVDLSGFSATASEAKASLTVVEETFSGFAATASDAKATLSVTRDLSGFAATANDAFAGLTILDASIEKDLTITVGVTRPTQDVETTLIKETVSVSPSDVNRGL